MPKGKLRSIREMKQNNPGFRNRAIRATLANRLQRSVNVLLGSVLASIGLTIPFVIAVSLATGRVLVFGLDATGTVMLLLTLITSMLTFSMPRDCCGSGC